MGHNIYWLTYLKGPWEEPEAIYRKLIGEFHLWELKEPNYPQGLGFWNCLPSSEMVLAKTRGYNSKFGLTSTEILEAYELLIEMVF